MGFQFLPATSSSSWQGRSSSQQQTEPPRTTKSFGGEEESTGHHQQHGQSKQSASGTTKTKRPHKKLLSKLTTRYLNNFNNGNTNNIHPTTPANAEGGSVTTPATAKETTITKQQQQQPNRFFDLQYHDTVTHTLLLEEQERIRQQLFYEEEGVEVTAQFQPRSSPPPSSKKSQQKKTTTSVSHHNNAQAEEQDEEDNKEENRDDSNSIISCFCGSPSRNNKKDNNKQKSSKKDKAKPPKVVAAAEPETLTDETQNVTEHDPIQHFPAVAKAVAQAKEEQIKRNASLASKRSTASSASSDIRSSTTTVVTKSASHNNHPHHYRSDDRPFDEEDAGPEDPTIMELENGKGNNNHNPYDDGHDDGMVVEDMFGFAACGGVVSHGPTFRGTTAAATRTPKTTTTTNSSSNITCKAVASAASVPHELLEEVFHCGGNDLNDTNNDFTEFSGSIQTTQQSSSLRSCRLVDAFYDNSCWTYQEAVSMNRPFYDEAFTRKFLKDITEDGINILWHLPPDDADASMDSVNWSGRSVVMKIQPGSCYSNNDAEPKLVWTTLGGGMNGNKKGKVARCLIPLMAIQSVSTLAEMTRRGTAGGAGDEIKEEEVTDNSRGVNLIPLEDEEDVCLFSITTEEGDVQVFEAATPRERDLLVAGLKNVVARLSFHVIVGDAGASSELYSEEEQDIPMGEMPSMASPMKNMNRIAHAMMD